MSKTDNMYNVDNMKIKLLRHINEFLVKHNYINIHTCYNLTVPFQWKIENRINDDYHIVYIKGGTGYYEMENEKINFEKGKIIFVSPDEWHSAKQSVSNPPQIIPVRFGIYDFISRRSIQFKLPSFSITFVSQNFEEYHLLFEKLYYYHTNKQKEHFNYLSGATLTEILLRMGNEFIENKEGRNGDCRIEKVRRYIDENPIMRLTNDELANIAGLTERYFRDVFKMQTGHTPKEYQIQKRIEHAKFLMDESGLNVKAAALISGYPDPYSFSKQFRKVLGYSPSKTRVEL